jgi:hypothetical protein
MKTYSNADMLNLLGSERITWICPEAFHPSIGNAIGEYNEGFNKLGTGITGERSIPSPANVGKGAQEASERDQAIAPEN